MSGDDTRRSGNKRGENKGIASAARDQRRTDANARQRSRNLRTPAEQLALLDTRPGSSKRERGRLAGS